MLSDLVQFVVNGAIRSPCELPHPAAWLGLLVWGESVQRAELVSSEHYGGTLSGALVCLIVGTLHEVGNVHAARKEGRKSHIYGGYVLPGLRQAVEVSGGTAQQLQAVGCQHGREVLGGVGSRGVRDFAGLASRSICASFGGCVVGCAVGGRQVFIYSPYFAKLLAPFFAIFRAVAGHGVRVLGLLG